MYVTHPLGSPKFYRLLPPSLSFFDVSRISLKFARRGLEQEIVSLEYLFMNMVSVQKYTITNSLSVFEIWLNSACLM